MKPRLPSLAAALLLAVPAASRADDLLDAVLWDGPSAFPSEAATEHEPPPPPAPEPEPAPAPVYPSRSTYSPRSPSPSPTTLPAAPAPAASPSVPAAFSPAALSGAVPAAFAPAALSDALPAAVAPAAPAALSGETQIRREIQEMRARADRLEAALGPAEPQKPARPQYDRADWPQRARLSLRGGIVADNFSDDKNGMGGGELAFPLPGMPFDIAVRGSYFRYLSEKREYVSSKRISVDSIAKNVFELICWGMWYPLRGEVFSPYVGVGAGGQFISGDRHPYILRKRSYYWNMEDADNYSSLDDKKLTIAGRVGATLTYKRLTLKGEILLTSESREYLAEAGLRIWEHLVLNAIVERYDIEKPLTAFGGGVTILF
jgi:hypothetical protein